MLQIINSYSTIEKSIHRIYVTTVVTRIDIEARPRPHLFVFIPTGGADLVRVFLPARVSVQLSRDFGIKVAGFPGNSHHSHFSPIGTTCQDA